MVQGKAAFPIRCSLHFITQICHKNTQQPNPWDPEMNLDSLPNPMRAAPRSHHQWQRRGGRQQPPLGRFSVVAQRPRHISISHRVLLGLHPNLQPLLIVRPQTILCFLPIPPPQVHGAGKEDEREREVVGMGLGGVSKSESPQQPPREPL